MQLYEIYFSPTGGTKKVADILTDGFESERMEIDITDCIDKLSVYNFEKEDLAVIAIPSFGGRVPLSLNERLSLLNGNGAKAIIVCVYGNRAYEDTLAELEDIVKANGFHVISAVAAIAEHSIAHQFATGRPDVTDYEQLKLFSEKIKEKLNKSDYAEPSIPGNRPYKIRGVSKIVPIAANECVKCGLCAEKCPVKAIDINNPSLVDNNACISCMRCVSVCPHNACKVNNALIETLGMALQKACNIRKENELYI